MKKRSNKRIKRTNNNLTNEQLIQGTNEQLNEPENHIVCEGEDGRDPGAEPPVHLVPVSHGAYALTLTLT